MELKQQLSAPACRLISSQEIQDDNYIEMFLEIAKEYDVSPKNFSSKNISNGKILQRQNQIKNLLKAFSKHITTINDPDIKQIYSQLYGNSQLTYQSLKKTVIKRVKDKQTRWNMKLKSILLSKGIKLVFNHFLQNYSSAWLETSKVADKSQLQILINVLLYLMATDSKFEVIKTYKK